MACLELILPIQNDEEPNFGYWLKPYNKMEALGMFSLISYYSHLNIAQRLHLQTKNICANNLQRTNWFFYFNQKLWRNKTSIKSKGGNNEIFRLVNREKNDGNRNWDTSNI
jgi:hypothetical protein